MPELFRKRGNLSPMAFKSLCSSGNVSLLWDIGALCAARWLIVAQCHLIKSLYRKYFYKLPKSRLAGKFQMCFHEKAVRSRWCLSPVLKCSAGTLRALCTIACKPWPNQRKRACSWKALWICQRIPSLLNSSISLN